MPAVRPAWDCAIKVHTAVPHHDDDGDDDDGDEDVGGDSDGDGEDDYYGNCEAWQCHKGTKRCGSALVALQRVLNTLPCTALYYILHSAYNTLKFTLNNV